MRLGILVLVALLAGCARDPPPLVAGEPVYSDRDVPPGEGLAPLRWNALAEGTHALAPGAALQSSVTVPNGTLTVTVNLTVEQGALTGLLVTLGECRWERDVVLVTGQEGAVDCGGIGDGESALFVATDAGGAMVRWAVVALQCDAREGRCPPRAPVTTA